MGASNTISNARHGTVLFEPWSLGDVIVAAAALRELSVPTSLACHPVWHPILRSVLPAAFHDRLIAIELPYTTRNRAHGLDFAGGQSLPRIPARGVWSIRGDPRDYSAARKIFPDAKIKMTGWVRFLARKNSLFDLPYRFGFLPVENRYVSWAELTEIPFTKITATYSAMREQAPKNRRAVIHLGAQWRSKQYPHVLELRALLESAGWTVQLLASRIDKLGGIPETNVARVDDTDLVHALRSAEQVITNDSGPMHLAAFLGCRTTVIVRTASIEEWRPPLVKVIASPLTPRGYRQKRHYMSDEVLSGWPEPPAIATSIERDL